MNLKSTWLKLLNLLITPLVRSHNSLLSKFIGLSAKSIYFIYENSNYDPYTNGEDRVLKELCKIKRLQKDIFDVGANNGDWTEMARNICGNSTRIHCFEIIPDTFIHLKKKVKNLPNVVLNNVGLSNKEQNVTVFFDPNHSGTSTIFEPMFYGKEGHEKECKVIEGDSYIKGNNIESIDYLKIDVEGMENLVLNGLKDTLEKKMINVIQFEYGMVNIQSKYLLKDFYELLTSYGYKIGKIYPGMVLFKEYEYYDENFIGPNYLAVHSECKDILSRLGS